MIFKFCPLCGSKMESFVEDGFPREKCTACKWVHYHNPRPTVSAIISRSDGKILLCHRPVNPFKGKWDSPGGFMEEKENPEDSLRREMKEELGIEIKIKRLIGMFGPTYYPFGGQDVYNTDIYYEVEPIGEIKVDKDSDVTEVAWFFPNQLPDMAFPANVLAIKKWEE